MWPCKEGSALQPKLVFTRGLRPEGWSSVGLGHFSASQSSWLSERLSCRAAASAQSSKDGSRASQQHRPTPSNTIPAPITSARTGISQKCSFPALLCPLKHNLPEQPLPARATAEGVSSLHFHFCSLFHPSDQDSDSDSD